MIQQCLLAFSLALLGWMLTIYSARMFGALNLFRGLILQELVALLVFLALVLLLRDALGKYLNDSPALEGRTWRHLAVPVNR